MSHWIPVTRSELRRGLLRDAAKARRFAKQRPELAEYALRIAALREQGDEWLRRPRTKAQP